MREGREEGRGKVQRMERVRVTVGKITCKELWY